MPADTEILPPRYRSVRPLARGGMAEIFVATDETLGRTVAVKVLAEQFSREEALRARFTREALAAARLSGDPNTVTIYDVGEWNDRPYIVMEHLAGGSLAERVGPQGVSPGQALRWLEQAAAALDLAHEHGVVHRDVKPANLLVGSDGAIRVADFGIASAVGLTSLTAPGTVLGTLGYLAPEQAAGGEIGPAADRYALAVVAYELLAGRRPFAEATGAGEPAAAARKPVPRISAEAPGLPRSLDPVFERALARDPEARYGSCAAFVADLRAALDDEAGPTRMLAATGPAPRHRLPRTLAAALVLALLAGGGIAAAMLARGDSGGEATTAARPKPQRVTVTARGDTVTVTTPPTTAAQATSPPPQTAQPPDTASASGVELNDRGYGLLQQGEYEQALPYFEQAVQKLQGTGSTAEAYADYNLALTRFALGSCDGVAALLDRSEQLQGRRKEISSLRKDVRKKCR